MPTYAYRCTECGTAFDVHQEFSDDSLTECPNCGGKLRKLFGTVGVTFNGSGFYRNDSRASAEKGSGGDKGSSSSGESGSSSDSGSSAPSPSAPPAATPSSSPSSSPAPSSTPTASPSQS